MQVELDDIEFGLRTGESPSWLDDAEPPYLFKGRTRLPRTNGYWVGEPGNGVWYPDNEAAKSVLKGAGVEFKNGRPDFSSWMNGKPLVFNPGDLDGSRRDFDAVYEVIRIKLKLPSKEAAKRLLRERGLTPHHHDDRTIQLIPTDLHGNVPHIGSASDMRIIAGK